jgi:hypothetical protein
VGCTIAGGQHVAPGGLPIGPDDTCDGRRVLDLVARVTLVGDRGAQFEVHSNPCPVHYVPRVKASFPGFLCRKSEHDCLEGAF